MSSGTHALPVAWDQSWLRSLDSNQGPSGYEPDELPLLHSAIRSIPPGLVALRRRGRTRGRARRRVDEVQLFARLRVSAEPRHLLVRGARLQRLHVLLVARVLRRDLRILLLQVGDLLAQAVADVGLLRERDSAPYQADADGDDDDGVAHAERVRAHAARDSQSSGLSHAATFVVKDGGGADYIKRSARLLPELKLFAIVEVGEAPAFAAQRRLHRGKARPEPLARHAQRVLGVDLQRACERDDREQQVPHLLERAVVVARVGGELTRLLGNRLGSRGGGREVETHSRRALLQAQ